MPETVAINRRRVEIDKADGADPSDSAQNARRV
jgi:hypothetical protein